MRSGTKIPGLALALVAILATPSPAAEPLSGKWKGTASNAGEVTFKVRGHAQKIEKLFRIEALGPPVCFEPPPEGFVLPPQTNAVTFDEMFIDPGNTIVQDRGHFGSVFHPGALDAPDNYAYQADAGFFIEGKFTSKKKATGEYLVTSLAFIDIPFGYEDCYVINMGTWSARKR